MEKTILTQDQVLAMFDYRDGDIYWKERPRSDFDSDWGWKLCNRIYAGKKAGYNHVKQRCVSVRIHYSLYLVHRIIFLMHYGYLPKTIDHIDGNPKNNRIENLRAATSFENCRNMKISKRNKSGHKGVCWNKAAKRWRARLNHHRKEYTVGYFKNIEDAATAIRNARESLHGEFARHE